MDRKKRKISDPDGDNAGHTPEARFPLERLSDSAFVWDLEAGGSTLGQHDGYLLQHVVAAAVPPPNIGEGMAMAPVGVLHGGTDQKMGTPDLQHRHDGYLQDVTAAAAAAHIGEGTAMAPDQGMGTPALQSMEGQLPFVNSPNRSLLQRAETGMGAALSPPAAPWNAGTSLMTSPRHDATAPMAAGEESGGRGDRVIADPTNCLVQSDAIITVETKQIMELAVARLVAEQGRQAAEQREQQVRVAARQREQQVLAVAQQQAQARLGAEQEVLRIQGIAAAEKQSRLAAEREKQQVVAITEKKVRSLQLKVAFQEHQLQAEKSQRQAIEREIEAAMPEAQPGNVVGVEDTASSAAAPPGRSPSPARQTTTPTRMWAEKGSTSKQMLRKAAQPNQKEQPTT
uniref:Uncharacterized protein n=1 Tax=Leersia perrieri TaxID=77586 RepID=A0A0D9W8Q6_9ORYZ